MPLNTLVDKFSHSRFEPAGFTTNPEIPIAKSINDYIFRWLASKFLSVDQQKEVGVIFRDEEPGGGTRPTGVPAATGATPMFTNQQDAPSCHACGSIMVRNGSCYRCLECGETSGCS